MPRTPAPLAAALAALLAVPAAAQVVSVECPHSSVRRTITTPLPGGWWTTPIVERLSGTRVTSLGGAPALQCLYGAAGSVQRAAPEGLPCRATRTGFRCAPETFHTARAELRQTFTLDLDRSSGAHAAADVWFEAEARNALFLTPMNGARLASDHHGLRQYLGCRAARYGGRIPLSRLSVGSYVCVRTNEGRVAQLRVNAATAGSPGTLSLGFTTWR